MKNKLKNKLDEYILTSLKDGDCSVIDSYLENNGYDLNNINDIAEKSYKRTVFSINGQINYQKDELLLEKAVKYFQDAINKNIEKPISYLRNIIETKQVAFHYSNLDKLSSDEIKNLIKEHNLLEIIENLEIDDKP